jgi:hypothetical protein
MANEALRAHVRLKLHTYIENRIKDNEPEPWRVVGSDAQTGMMQVAPETDSGSDPRQIVEIPQMAFTSPNTGDRIRVKKGRSQPGWYAEGFSYDGTNERTYPETMFADIVRARDASDLKLQDDNAGLVTLSSLTSAAPIDAKYVVTAANPTLTAEVVMPTSAAVMGTNGSNEPIASTAGEDYLNPDGLIYAVPPELTISAGGAVTATKSYHTIDTNGDAASDNLDTINWGGDGAGNSLVEIIVKANNDGRTVVIKHLTGNIYSMTGDDITLDTITKHARLLFDIGAGGCYAWPIAPALTAAEVEGVGAVMEADFNAKGDLLSASADDTPAILSIGTDGQILYADSGEATGQRWDDPPSGGDSFEFTITAGENLSELDYVYLNPADNEWYQVDIDDATPEISADRAIVTESGGITASGTGSAQRIGVVAGFTGLSAGEDVWASTTAGGYTQTKPAPSDGGAQLAIVRIGVAVSTTQILLTPEDKVTYAKRDSMAEDGTLTIVHHSDPVGRTRTARAYATIAAAGSKLEEYADTNQDADIQLRGQAGAGGTETIDNAGSNTIALGDLGGTEYWVAQKFQVSAAGILSQFTIEFGVEVGSVSGDVTWKVCADDAGGSDPGTTLDTGTFAPTPSSDNTINPSGGVFLDTSTTYWLVFEVAAQSTSNYWQMIANNTPMQMARSGAQRIVGQAGQNCLAMTCGPPSQPQPWLIGITWRRASR